MLQKSDIISGNEDFTIVEEAPIWAKHFQIDDLYKMFLENIYIYIAFWFWVFVRLFHLT